jgi:peptidoglycan/xylan/chitin deacetylase (PgdA/CDA1 family)
MSPTVLMYHYVRTDNYSQFKNINYLDASTFEKQLKSFLFEGYKFISLDDFLEADNSTGSPSILLTFDDGYKEHHDIVAPILNQLGIQGAFFQPTLTLTEDNVLLVNKIHIILSENSDRKSLAQRLEKFMVGEASIGGVESKRLKNEYLQSGRFDDPYTNFVKRSLQLGMSERAAERFLNLEAVSIGIDWSNVAENLYMSVSDLLNLKRTGHHVGLHGHRHLHYDQLDEINQRIDIERSLELLVNFGLVGSSFCMAYPYGSYDNITTQLLEELGCKAAFIDNMENISEEFPQFSIQRLDCNYIRDRFSIFH